MLADRCERLPAAFARRQPVRCTTMKSASLAAACALIVAVVSLAAPSAAHSRDLKLCGKNGGESFKPPWIGRSGYDFVWYVYVDQMTCRSARAAINRGQSAGKDTFRAPGYRCRKTVSNDYGVGLTRDVYRCTRGPQVFKFTAYD